MTDEMRAVTVRLKGLGRRATLQAARSAAEAMGDAFVEAVVDTELSTYSHTRGTPTPSPPGSPPARISGSLARSVKADPPIPIGRRWQTEVGPRIVYGRIQELGGEAGSEKHRVTLPPRPYLAPAVARLSADGTLTRVAVEAFTEAMGK